MVKIENISFLANLTIKVVDTDREYLTSSAIEEICKKTKGMKYIGEKVCAVNFDDFLRYRRAYKFVKYGGVNFAVEEVTSTGFHHEIKLKGIPEELIKSELFEDIGNYDCYLSYSNPAVDPRVKFKMYYKNEEEKEMKERQEAMGGERVATIFNLL